MPTSTSPPMILRSEDGKPMLWLVVSLIIPIHGIYSATTLISFSISNDDELCSSLMSGDWRRRPPCLDRKVTANNM